MADAVVRLSNVRFGFAERLILDGFDLTLDAGQVTAILGPSGSGKTTLLRLISGMARPASGDIEIIVAPGQTPIAYMFQDYDTFPWLTVRRNLRLSGERDDAQIEVAAGELGLGGLLHRYPRQLSGGQRKRVALARGLLARPALMIMDEPFGSLDVRTKISIFDLFETRFRDKSRTSLFVTHSVEEAMMLADRIIVTHGPPLHVVDDVRVTGPRGSARAALLVSDVFRAAEARVMGQLLRNAR